MVKVVMEQVEQDQTPTMVVEVVRVAAQVAPVDIIIIQQIHLPALETMAEEAFIAVFLLPPV
jgi:hypothetical protein